jgi:hypothetical protein
MGWLDCPFRERYCAGWSSSQRLPSGRSITVARAGGQTSHVSNWTQARSKTLGRNRCARYSCRCSVGLGSRCVRNRIRDSPFDHAARREDENCSQGRQVPPLRVGRTTRGGVVGATCEWNASAWKRHHRKGTTNEQDSRNQPEVWAVCARYACVTPEQHSEAVSAEGES